MHSEYRLSRSRSQEVDSARSQRWKIHPKLVLARADASGDGPVEFVVDLDGEGLHLTHLLLGGG